MRLRLTAAVLAWLLAMLAVASAAAQKPAPAPLVAAPAPGWSVPAAKQLAPPLFDSKSLLADLRRRLPAGMTLPDKLPAAPPTVKQVSVSCPTQKVTLTTGTDLFDAFQKPANGEGVTYLLPSGTYTLNNTIVLQTGQVTCYQGIDPETGGAAPKESVRVLVDTAASVNFDSRAFYVQNGAQLSLKNLLMDGQGSSAGIAAVLASSLETTDVTLQRFKSDANGAAVRLIQADGSFMRTSFLENSAPNGLGGAIDLFFSSATFIDVDFARNLALIGGAIFIQSSPVTVSGACGMFDNKAVGLPGIGVTGMYPDKGNRLLPPGLGGAMGVVFDSSVTINGSLCGQGNTADTSGGFAYVLQAQLLFSADSQVKLGLNSPDTIALPTSSDFVRCGTGSDSPWAAPNSYTITGAACACNDDFVNNRSTTCDSCDGKVWAPSICSCRQCQNLGQGCCGPDGAFQQAGFKCRPARGPCDVPEVCLGSSEDCPGDDKAPDGTLCKNLYALGGKKHHRGYAPHAQAQGGVQDLQATVTYTRDGKPHYHHHDAGRDYPTRQKYNSAWSWAKPCPGTCMAGKCYTSPKQEKECLLGYGY